MFVLKTKINIIVFGHLDFTLFKLNQESGWGRNLQQDRGVVELDFGVMGSATDTFCQVLGPETDPLCQFLDPENLNMSKFQFEWIFLVPIELIHNPEHVQIVFSFSIDQNSFLKTFETRN